MPLRNPQEHVRRTAYNQNVTLRLPRSVCHVAFVGLGSVSRKSRELFGSGKPVVKMPSACLEKLIFEHIFNVRKTKRIATVHGFDPRRCEDIKGFVASEIGPKSFGTFEKQAPGHSWAFSNLLIIHEEKTKEIITVKEV